MSAVPHQLDRGRQRYSAFLCPTAAIAIPVGDSKTRRKRTWLSFESSIPESVPGACILGAPGFVPKSVPAPFLLHRLIGSAGEWKTANDGTRKAAHLSALWALAAPSQARESLSDDTPPSACQKRDEESFTSAFRHTSWNCCSTSEANSTFPWARRLCASPNSDQPLAGFLRRSSQ